MRRFIYNTEGTGISHEQIRRLENTQPGAGTYLGEAMHGHLGDEIMLLEGLDGEDADALAGLGFVGQGNYVTRSYDMSGFSVSMPRSRRSGRDFRPYGLGAPEVEDEDIRTRPDAFIGPNFYPLEGSPTPSERRTGRDFQPYGLGFGPATDRTQAVRYVGIPKVETFFNGARLETANLASEDWSDEDGGYQMYRTPSVGTWLNGLGDAQQDRARALATAQSVLSLCRSACQIGYAQVAQSADRRRCEGGCDAAYAAAEVAINAAIPAGSSGTTSPEQMNIINAKIAALQERARQAEQGNTPPVESGMSTNTKLLIGAGVVGLGLVAIIALRR